MSRSPHIPNDNGPKIVEQKRQDKSVGISGAENNKATHWVALLNK